MVDQIHGHLPGPKIIVCNMKSEVYNTIYITLNLIFKLF